ncbi:MAG TPA: HAD family hydrolase [Acidobacteriaceae bacterium]|nr:HAD family hydrolase [Acidobacteriaceae bacterium]
MQQTSPSAILCDPDGVLIDTRRLDVECYRRALAPYLYRDVTEAEILARWSGSERQFIREWIGERYAEECLAAVRRHYAALHTSLGGGVYEGVREMLAALRSAGYPLGVVSGKGREAWEVTERELALGPFAAVVTDDDASAPEPEVERLLTAARAMGVDGAHCVYVCASADALHAGRSAGMRVAAALWPMTESGEAERFVNEAAAYAPDYTFARPADVTRAFAAWC